MLTARTILPAFMIGCLSVANAAAPPASQPAGSDGGGLVTVAASARRADIKRTVFAAPCENATGEDSYEPAAAALGDLVGVMLAQQDHIAVVERQRLEALTSEQAKSLAGLTASAHAVEAGKLLRADTALVGRLFLVAKRLTISIQAIDIASERVLAASQAACDPGNLPGAALQVAAKLAEQMALPLPVIDVAKIDKSPIASLHFAKALGHYHAGNMDEAILQLMRTIDLDPDYVDARYWLGLAYQRLGEDGHAIIEWRALLARRPDGKNAAELRRLIREAEEREKASTVQRLGPTSSPERH